MDLEDRLKPLSDFGLHNHELQSALDNINSESDCVKSLNIEAQDQSKCTNAKVFNQYKKNYKFYPDIIWIPILSFYGGDYRLEYDGKYISLYGKDKNYETFSYGDKQEDSFEEMLLIPIVKEIRNANPQIIQVTDIEIVIDLGVKI